MAEAAGPPPPAEREFLSYDGPVKGVKYPTRVKYCGGEYLSILFCARIRLIQHIGLVKEKLVA